MVSSSVYRLLLTVLAVLAMAGNATAVVNDVRSDLKNNPTDTVWCSNANLSSAAGEFVTRLFDTDTTVTAGDKWLSYMYNNNNSNVTCTPNAGLTVRAWVVYQFSAGKSYTIGSYDFYTGNDHPERAPVSWNLLGSNDGKTWTMLDNTHRDYGTPTTPNTRVGPFPLTAPGCNMGCYNMYRFEVLKVRGWDPTLNQINAGTNTDQACQMAELRLHDVSAALPLAPTVTPPMNLAPSPTGALSFTATVAAASKDGGTVTYEWHVVDSTDTELPDAAFPNGRTTTGGNTTSTSTVQVNVLQAGTYYAWVMVRSSTGTGVRYPSLDTLTRNKTATCSAVVAGNEPGKAVDGDPNALITPYTITSWASADDTQCYLQVDLGAPTFIDRVTIQWHDIYYASRFQVLGGLTGNDWTLMADKPANYDPGHDLTTANGLTAATIRYLRIRCIATNNTKFSIDELNATSPGQAVAVLGTPIDQPAFAGQSSLKYTATTQGIKFPPVAADTFSNGLTFTAWIRPSDVSIGNRIVYFGNSTDANGAVGPDEISLQFNGSTGGNDLLQLIISDNTTPTPVILATLNAAVPTSTLRNLWNQIAITIPGTVGGTVTMYLNGGTPALATANLSGLPSFARNFLLGVNAVNKQPFQGQMRDIRIWNRVLSRTEILNALVVPLNGNESGLIGWYPCTCPAVGDATLCNRADSNALQSGIIQDTGISYTGQRSCAPTATVPPFLNMELVDRDTTLNATNVYPYSGTLTLSDATVGSLKGTGVNPVTGSPGVYTITATGLPAFQNQLQGLLFTPALALQTTLSPGQTIATRLTLAFGDGHAPGISVADANITVGSTVSSGLNANWWVSATAPANAPTIPTTPPTLTNVVSAFDPVVLFPASLGTTTNIIAQFTGIFVPPPSLNGRYKFHLLVDDYAWAWVNGVMINGGGNNNETYSNNVYSFVPGQPMTIQVLYVQVGGGYKLTFSLQDQATGNADIDISPYLFPVNTPYLPEDQPPFCNLQAVHFVGGSSAVRLPPLRLNAPMTIEAWIRDERQTAGADFVFLRSNDGRNIHFRSGWGNNIPGNNITESIDTVTNGYIPGGAGAITQLSTTTWEHWAMVLRAASPRGTIYRNGVAVTTGDIGLAAAAISPSASGEEALLGYGWEGGTAIPLRGSLSDVRIWGVERTPIEIRNHMTQPLTGNEPGLLAWYLHSDDLGKTLSDQSGNLGAGRLENGANIIVPQVACNTLGVTPKNTVTPFAHAVLTDPDTATTATAIYNYTVTIAMDNATKGFLTGDTLQAMGPNGTAPFVFKTIGLGATQALLRKLVYTPADGRPAESATFFITIADDHASSAGTYQCSVQSTAVDTSGAITSTAQPPFISLPAVAMGSGNRSSDQPFGDYVQLPVIPMGPRSTVEMWVKTDGPLTYDCRLLEMATQRNDGGTSNRDAFRVFANGGSGILRFSTYNGTTACAASVPQSELAASAFPVNTWTHVAAVVDDSGGKAVATLYVNGQMSVSYPMWPAMSTVNRTIAYLGRANGSGSPDKYFQGWMKDIRIWNAARTQAQIQAYRTCPVNTADPALLAYYQTVQLGLDGQVLYDASTTAGHVGPAMLVNNAQFKGLSRIRSDASVQEACQPFAQVELLDPDHADQSATFYTATITQQDSTGVTDAAQALGVMSGAGVAVVGGVATITVQGLASLQTSLQQLAFAPAPQAANTTALVNFQVSIQPQNLNVASVGQAALVITGYPLAISDQPPFVSLSALRLATDTAKTPAVFNMPILPVGTFAAGTATLECWVKAYNPWSGWGRIIQLGVSAANNTGFMLAQQDTLGCLFSEAFNGNNTSIGQVSGRTPSGIISLPLNQWVHVAAVYNGTALTLYCNGQQEGTGTLSQNIPNVAYNVCRLGLDPNNGQANQFSGEISSVRIWNVVRTQAQIQDAMTRSDLSTATTGLLLWYQFNNLNISNSSTAAAATTANITGANGAINPINVTYTGILPTIALGEICQPFKNIELVDPDSGAAATADTVYNLTVSVAAGDPGQIWNVAGIWVNPVGGATLQVTGLANAQAALRRIDFRRTTLAGTAPSTVTATVTVMVNGVPGPSSTGAVQIPVQDLGLGTPPDQPPFCSLSALHMDGTLGISQMVTLPVFSAGGAALPLTAEAWVKISGALFPPPGGAPLTNQGALWDLGNGANLNNAALRLIQNAAVGGACWGSKVVPNGTLYTSSVPVSFGTWQHVAVSYDGTTNNETCYINGIQVYQRNFTGPLNLINRLARFGQDYDGNFGYVREIKDLRIWNVVRNQQQIHDYMTRPFFPTAQANLLAWYQCFETDGATLTNGATLAGTALGAASIVGSPSFTGATTGAIGRPLTPFASAELTDPDTARAVCETMTYTITLAIDGHSTGTGVLSTNLITGNGISDAQAQLRAVTFTPSAAGIVRFIIFIGDSQSQYTYQSSAACYVNADQPVFCNLPAVKFTSDLDTGTAGGDYVKLPNIDIGGSVTLEAWVKDADVSANWARIYDMGSGGPHSNIILAYSGTSAILQGSYYNVAASIGTGTVNDTTGFPQSTWTHVAAVFAAKADPQGPASLLYRNGMPTGITAPYPPASAVDLAAPDVTRNASNIGKSNWTGNRYFRGEMKGFRIWNVARTQAQILGAMTAPVARNEAGLVADFPSAYYDPVAGLISDSTLGQTMQNTCTNSVANPFGAAAILASAVLQGNTTTNVNDTISAPFKVFGVAEIFDPDTSTALTDTYHYTVDLQVRSGNKDISDQSIGTLSGTNVTYQSGGMYKLKATGLGTMLDNLRNVVFTPSPVTANTPAWFELAIWDEHATYGSGPSVGLPLATRGRVDITIASASAAGVSLPPVPVDPKTGLSTPPYLTGPNGAPPVATVGWTLVCHPGTWSDYYNPGQAAVTSFAYLWYLVSADANGVVTYAPILNAVTGLPENTATHLVTNADMGTLAASPVNSLICQVTATSTLTGLWATAWSNALQVNKYGVVTTAPSLANLALTATENTDAKSISLNLNVVPTVYDNLVAQDPATLAYYWTVLLPPGGFGNGSPAFTSVWTATPTNNVVLDRVGQYQFAVAIYDHATVVNGAVVSVAGQSTAPIPSNVLTVSATPLLSLTASDAFSVSPASTQVPAGGFQDFTVTFRDQFRNPYVLGSQYADEQLHWSIDKPVGDLTEWSAGNEFDYRFKASGDPANINTTATITVTWSDSNYVALNRLPLSVPPVTYSATATVTITSGKLWKINFQPKMSQPIDPFPAGAWYIDGGDPFSYRGQQDKYGNQLFYGWVQGPNGGISLDMTSSTRDRNDLRGAAPSVTLIQTGTWADDPATIRRLYDTCILTQRRAVPDMVDPPKSTPASAVEVVNSRWEITVPNGTYSVTLICGDPSYTNSVFSFNVNDQPCTPTGVVPIADGFLGNWCFPTTPANFTVTAGRIYITEGNGAVNNKLCGVLIQQISASN